MPTIKLWAMCFMLALPICGAMALFHAVDHHPPPAPVRQLVTFDQGTYSSDGGTFGVAVTNGNTAPVTVHTIRVRFVNDRAPAVITDVTERAAATVPAGHSTALTYPAPRAVVNTAVRDRAVIVSVTGWS